MDASGGEAEEAVMFGGLLVGDDVGGGRGLVDEVLEEDLEFCAVLLEVVVLLAEVVEGAFACSESLTTECLGDLPVFGLVDEVLDDSPEVPAVGVLGEYCRPGFLRRRCDGRARSPATRCARASRGPSAPGRRWRSPGWRSECVARR